MAERSDEERDRTQPAGGRAKRRRVKRRAASEKDAPVIDGGGAAAPQGAGPARPRRWRGVVGALAALAVAALLAAAYLAWPSLQPRRVAETEAAGSAALAAVESRLADLEAALGRGAAQPAGGDEAGRIADLGAALAALDDRIAALDEAAQPVPGLAERLAALEEGVAAAPSAGGGAGVAGLADRIDALERAVAAAPEGVALGALESKIERLVALAGDLVGRIAALERRSAPAAGTSPALLLAVGQLRAALRGSGPFDVELDALLAVAADDPEVGGAVAALTERAREGVPTLDVLRAGFAAIAGPVVRADDAPEEASRVERWISRFTSLVTVRPVGDVPGDSADAVVARAEARLAEGDLAEAVAEVEGLEGAPAEAAADWLADARARLAAERALAALDARAVAALGTAGGGG